MEISFRFLTSPVAFADRVRAVVGGRGVEVRGTELRLAFSAAVMLAERDPELYEELYNGGINENSSAF